MYVCIYKDIVYVGICLYNSTSIAIEFWVPQKVSFFFVLLIYVLVSFGTHDPQLFPSVPSPQKNTLCSHLRLVFLSPPPARH